MKQQVTKKNLSESNFPEPSQKDGSGLGWFEKKYILLKLSFFCITHPIKVRVFEFQAAHDTGNQGIRRDYFINIAPFVVLIAMLVSLFMQSSLALPGDALYEIKTRVVEPLYIFTKSIDGKKFELAMLSLQFRMQELEQLVANKQVTPAAFEMLRSALQRNIDDAYAAAEESREAARDTLRLSEWIERNESKIKSITPQELTYVNGILDKLKKSGGISNYILKGD